MEGLEGITHIFILLLEFVLTAFPICKKFLLFFNAMQSHVKDIKKTHLRDLMNDTERCKSMMAYELFDYLI